MEKESSHRLAKELYFWLQTLAAGLTVLILVLVFVGRPVRVDGHSMDPTLADREILLLRSLGYTPRAGDIVVLHKDFDNVTDPIVKRIIAVGGQTVRIDYAAGTVAVDGVILEEDYILEPMRQQSWQSVTEIAVPEGSVFVMGDNRNVSDDSRDPSLGTVDQRYLLGQAVAVVFPLQDMKVFP